MSSFKLSGFRIAALFFFTIIILNGYGQDDFKDDSPEPTPTPIPTPTPRPQEECCEAAEDAGLFDDPSGGIGAYAIVICCDGEKHSCEIVPRDVIDDMTWGGWIAIRSCALHHENTHKNHTDDCDENRDDTYRPGWKEGGYYPQQGECEAYQQENVCLSEGGMAICERTYPDDPIMRAKCFQDVEDWYDVNLIHMYHPPRNYCEYGTPPPSSTPTPTPTPPPDPKELLYK